MTRSSSDVVSFVRGMGSSIDPCRAIQSPRFGAGSNPPAGIRAALTEYFKGDLGRLKAIKWRVAGTPFQRKVWNALPKIPAGTTMSYGALAAKLGMPKAVRAVGHANGSNPLSVVVPCHRLIGANGSLTGYGGGLARKQWLLEHEGVVLKKASRRG